MTGSDHYKEAQRLTESAEGELAQSQGSAAAIAYTAPIIALAQVHATLALAAATAMATTSQNIRAVSVAEQVAAWPETWSNVGAW